MTPHDRAPTGPTDDDLMALVASLDPEPDADAVAGADSARAHDDLQRILGAAQHRARRRPVGLLAAASLFAVAAGAATVTFWPDHDPMTVACFADARTDADTAVVAARRGGGPAAACGDVWREGSLGRGLPDHLVECVLPTGHVGVFPAQTCDQVHGLPGESPAVAATPSVTASPSGKPAAGPPGDVIDARDRLTGAFAERGCVPPDEARAAVQSEIEDGSLLEWEIEEAGPFTPGQPCASLAFDADRRRVLLVPLPPPPGE